MTSNSLFRAAALVVSLAFTVGVAVAADVPGPSQPAFDLPVAPGPFAGTMESLQAYKCPDWFRDAKFGIWAHWGPQSVPMDGDWYARGMYEQGSGHYKYHVEHYGHPSQFGYKDIIALWKAEKWDPERLMALYKKAGARYFVSMGTHHDNFFLWDSKLHKWNAVNMGPKRDVVATWKAAATKEGLKFGVSEHLAASFTWFQSSHGSDKTGPLAGVAYDGADPQYQDLYHFPAKAGDRGWTSNDPRWQQQWYNEIKELVDNYQPDLLYSDSGVPFGNTVGLSQIANLYNLSAARNAAVPQAVYTCKQAGDGRWVQDLERGVMPKINPFPWQTDTSIGDWFYNRNWKIRPVSWSIHTLVDVVSKNGNLLLNVVQRPDGSIDADVEQELEALAAWNAVNGEAIFGSRPWGVYGEGAIRYKGGAFKEDFNYSAKDIRFTTKDGTLYAIALGWPADGTLTIRSLAKPAGVIADVSLLGSDAKIDFTQTDEGLVVKLPADKPCDFAFTLKIPGGAKLTPAPLPDTVAITKPDADGSLTLSADMAQLHGDQVNSEDHDGQTNIGFWDRATEWISWRVKFDRAGKYNISIALAGPNASGFVLEAAGTHLQGQAPVTGDWARFQTLDAGTIEVKQAGEQEVALRPADAKTWKPMNVRWVKFVPAQQ